MIPRTRLATTLALFAALVLAGGCRQPAEDPPASATDTAATPRTDAAGGDVPTADLTPLDLGAVSQSAQPNLTAATDGAILSWLEKTGETSQALRVARLQSDRWSIPATVTERDDMFANWADFPSVIELRGGELLAHWLQKRPGGKYAYDVRYSLSNDAGATWSAGRLLHDDGTATEHGFVTLVPLADGRAAAIWLDGRAMAAGSHDAPGEAGDMALRLCVLERDGTITTSVVLDDRVCECCGTTAVLVGDTVHVFYRDRSADEVRDIGHVRALIGAEVEVGAPALLHADGWKIAGCPVNGPAAAADGERVAVAWFTMADDQPRVQVALSTDGAATFAEPLRVDGGEALGRLDVELSEGDAVVTWLEDGPETGEVWARRFGFDGVAGSPVIVTRVASARASGFPRLLARGDRLLLAWTEEIDDAKSVRLAFVTGIE